jgi:uncharacterized iron-regulated membrane protein
VLTDAETGALTAVADLPWYLRALEVSRPLHFGDYGAMPLNIIWGLLDLITIVVLAATGFISGLRAAGRYSNRVMSAVFTLGTAVFLTKRESTRW